MKITALLTLLLFSMRADLPAAENVHSFSAQDIGGNEVSLSSYSGKTLLIVNTASLCGFTKQYASLQKLYEKYNGRGFEVLAFPANNFGLQEPGSNEDIKKFCDLKFKVKFPLFSKVDVKGEKTHPLYRYLTEASPFPGEIEWNFNKFLVDPSGNVAARFPSSVEPLSKEMTDAVEKALPA